MKIVSICGTPEPTDTVEAVPKDGKEKRILIEGVQKWENICLRYQLLQHCSRVQYASCQTKIHEIEVESKKSQKDVIKIRKQTVHLYNYKTEE